MRPTLLVSCLLPFALVGTAWSAPELMTNGGFEAPTVSTLSCFQNNNSNGWTSFGPGANVGSCFVPSGAVSGALTFPLSHTGSQLLLVNNQEFVGTKIAQNVSLTAGVPYQLTFSMAGVTGDATNLGLTVTLAGVGSQTFTSPAGTTWSDKVWNFTPTTTGSPIISFTATAGYVNLDSLSLQSPVPEASQAAMLAAGVAVMLLAVRRRSMVR
ncbi:MAG: hypothetical protein RLZZ598_1379 [Pseudomonadota bacterium]|jgi:hypothetical protein